MKEKLATHRYANILKISKKWRLQLALNSGNSHFWFTESTSLSLLDMKPGFCVKRLITTERVVQFPTGNYIQYIFWVTFFFSGPFVSDLSHSEPAAPVLPPQSSSSPRQVLFVLYNSG